MGWCQQYGTSGDHQKGGNESMDGVLLIKLSVLTVNIVAEFDHIVWSNQKFDFVILLFS